MTRRHYFLIALVPALIFVLWHFLSPTRQLKAAQQRLVSAISLKDEAACSKLIHPDYTDQWSFSTSDWPLILKDLRALSPILEVKLLEPVYDASTGVVETGLQLKSTGGPASGLIDGNGARLRQNTRFLWKREPWRPWSWRLISVQNPDFEIPAGYRPGNITATALF